MVVMGGWVDAYVKGSGALPLVGVLGPREVNAASHCALHVLTHVLQLLHALHCVREAQVHDVRVDTELDTGEVVVEGHLWCGVVVWCGGWGWG